MADGGYSQPAQVVADETLLIYQLDQGLSQWGNTTLALIDSLLLSQSKSVRTSTVILASFNILVASATASSILYDCYWASKRRSVGYEAKKFCISVIHPAETFPFLVALVIIIQSCVFAGAQSTGLSSLFTDGCASVSQAVFPAIFLLPYIHVVFGIECALRSFRKGFPARGKYDVTICLGVTILMAIGTWIPMHLAPEMNHCFASLVWFVTQHGELGLILLATTSGIIIICAATVLYRLITIASIDQRQRIAASRMVYYLVLMVFSQTFVIPWFVTLTIQRPTLVTSMMATVVLNLQGLLNGVLHLFLRANTITTSFRPKGTSGWTRGQHEIRLWGPNELGFDGHLLQPVSGPRSPASIGSRQSLILTEKVRPTSTASLRSPPVAMSTNKTNSFTSRVFQLTKGLPKSPKPNADGSRENIPQAHRRNQSYSIFPLDLNLSNSIPRPKLSQESPDWKTQDSIDRERDTVMGLFSSSFSQRQTVGSSYDLDDLLEPPPPLRLNGHRRDSSMITSATVQIGLRLSHAMDEPEELVSSRSRSQSPLPRLQTQNLPISIYSLAHPSPLRRNAVEPLMLSAVRDARMKTLPPVPRVSTISRDSNAAESPIQLSPMVYSPQNSPQSAKKATMSPLSRPTPPSAPWPAPTRIGQSRGSKASWI